MSWVSTLEVATNREAGIDWRAKREYQREFLVTMSSLTDGSIQVSVAPGIPRLFDLFRDTDGTYDLGARCYDVRAKQDAEDPFRWHVTAKYSSGERSRYSRANPEKGDDRQNDPNPLNRPPIYIAGSRKAQTPVDVSFKREAFTFNGVTVVDIANAPVQNSSGEPFDPPVMKEDTLSTLTIIRNEASFDFGLPASYHDAINTDNFFGQPPYTVKVESINARSNIENNLAYWEVTYEFHFTRWNPPAEKGWLRLVVDRGFYAFNQLKCNDNLGNNVLRRILLPDGVNGCRPIVTPYQLDGAGGMNPNAPSTPLVFTYHIYPERSFAPLGLN